MWTWLRRPFGADHSQRETSLPVQLATVRIEAVGIPSPELRKALTVAIEKGTTVRIVYHGGSRPGSTRDIRPLSLAPDTLRATDTAEGIDKTFRLERIEIAAEGAAVTPPQATVHALELQPSSAPNAFTVEVMHRSYQRDVLARMLARRRASTQRYRDTCALYPQ